MSHAQKCPVCEGNGAIDARPCHGCNGKGWVAVPDDNGPASVPQPLPCPVEPYPGWIEPYRP